MSFRCDVDIKTNQIPKEHQFELYNLLLEFRPGYEGEIVNNEVKEFPCNFNDDFSGVLKDFMKKYKLTATFDAIFEDDEYYFYFIDGEETEEE